MGGSTVEILKGPGAYLVGRLVRVISEVLPLPNQWRKLGFLAPYRRHKNQACYCTQVVLSMSRSHFSPNVSVYAIESGQLTKQSTWLEPRHQ